MTPKQPKYFVRRTGGTWGIFERLPDDTGSTLVEGGFYRRRVAREAAAEWNAGARSNAAATTPEPRHTAIGSVLEHKGGRNTLIRKLYRRDSSTGAWIKVEG